MNVSLIHVFVCVIASFVHRTKANEATSLRITLHVFSGTPDPQWTIDRGDSSFDDILSLLSDHASTPLGSRLGYNGFTVEVLKAVTVIKTKIFGRCTLPDAEPFLLSVVRDRVPDGADSPLGQQVIQYVADQIHACQHVDTV